MARSPLVAVRLDPALLAALDAKVSKADSTRSEEITEALRKHLKTQTAALKRGRPAKAATPSA